MGKIHTKTIYGRKYRYERLSTKRVGGKVVTNDKYLGPVHPVQGAFDQMSVGDVKKMKEFWKSGATPGTLVAAVDTFTGRKYAESTVQKWCRSKFGKKGRK